jgi:hypothetical protein
MLPWTTNLEAEKGSFPLFLTMPLDAESRDLLG